MQRILKKYITSIGYKKGKFCYYKPFYKTKRFLKIFPKKVWVRDVMISCFSSGFIIAENNMAEEGVYKKTGVSYKDVNETSMKEIIQTFEK
jgi:hypothetical protein